MANQRVRYEWAIWEYDEFGDSTNVHHFETYAKLKDAYSYSDFEFPQIMLECSEHDGQDWEPLLTAMMKNGELPEYLEDAYGRKVRKVPKRFHKEVQKLEPQSLKGGLN